jgi:hypothetical protein
MIIQNKDIKGDGKMPRKKKDIIVRVHFSNNKIMMFGNSYKPWEMQFEEYLLMLKRNNTLEDVEDVTVSDSSWISWGGLKWCSEENFQHQLNREGCQSSEENNPNSRQYGQMRFLRDSSITEKVKKMVEDLKANIY